jgi:ferredoxin
MKILHDREKCIGCGACVSLCPKYWEMKEDGKAYLKGSELNPEGKYQLELKDPECNQQAADSCPVEIIFLVK